MSNANNLYVSSVADAVVERFSSTPGTTRGAYIGVRRIASGWLWATDEVVEIPATEYGRFRREYDAAIKRGDLKRRSPEEHQAWLNASAPAEPVAPVEPSEPSEPQPAAPSNPEEN